MSEMAPFSQYYCQTELDSTSIICSHCRKVLCKNKRVWLLTAPGDTGPVQGWKWLIISLRRLLRVELRCNSEPMVLELQLNKQDTSNMYVTNSSQASTRVNFFGQLQIISSSLGFKRYR